MHSTAVIIVTYNALPWAEKCFLPLKSTRQNHRVYIIDNGSSDGTQDFIINHCPEFTFLQSDVNLGFGKANNMGLESALKDGCTHFLLLNQDAQLSWEAIEELVQIQKKHVNYGILSPIHLYDQLNLDKKHLRTLMKSGDAYFNDLIVKKELAEVYEIKHTNAAIWLVSKECLRKAGGFDPLFNHYGEDSEYSKRVNNFGFKVGMCPKIKGFHFRSQEIGPIKDAFFINYLIKAKDHRNGLTITYLHIFFQLITNTPMLFVGKGSSSLKNRWKAFWRMILIKKQISNHLKISLDESFSFLRYQES